MSQVIERVEEAPPKTTRPQPARKFNPRYIVGIVGGLFLIFCGFLSWVSINYATINQHVSLNGLGAINSSSQVAKLNELPTFGGGVLTIVLGAIGLVLSVAALWINRTELAALLTAFGLFSLAIITYLLGDVFSKLGQINEIALTLFVTDRNGQKVGPPMTVGLDLGMLLAIAGAVMVVLAGVLPMTGKQRRPQPRRRV